jgi:FG-GAP-like repeat
MAMVTSMSARLLQETTVSSWYENSDGAGGFSSPKVIASGVAEPRWVVAADIDGDGDLDALAALYGEYSIVWYENDPLDNGAKGTFGTGQVITSTVPGVVSVAAADVDGDGDIDALAALAYDGSLAWYENIDGAGAFGSQRIISTLVERPYSILGADIDGDGDVDILGASIDDKKVAWYENSDGAGNFGPQQILSTLAYGSYGRADVDAGGQHLRPRPRGRPREP